VSYVLNGGPKPVGEDKRQRVLAAVEELGYYPNEIARSLAGQATRSIGVIAPTLVNPVWAKLTMGISDAISVYEYLMIVCDVEDQPDLDQRYAQMMVAKQVDGVILVPTANTPSTLSILDRGGIPAIVVEQDVFDAACVLVDAQDTGYRVTEHLTALGHRRIAILREHRSSLDSWKRYLGYEQALREAGLEVDPALVANGAASIDGSVVEGSIAAAGALLDVVPRPTAVFAHNDLMAIAVIQVARQRGLRVPEDLSVIGVDDADAGRYCEPPLTTLPFPARELGREAGVRILAAMGGGEVERLSVLPSPPLVIRGSTAPPPEGP
jgi:DNA-binding LacI/PurR family transcriptional regulator